MSMQTTSRPSIPIAISTFSRIGGLVLIVFGGLVLLASATAKFAHVPQVVEELQRFGIGGEKLVIVAVLEVVSAALVLIPATRSLGLLLVSAYLGGAIATHFQQDQPVFAPAVVLLVIWAGTWLRHPHLFRRESI